jgi:hypothetical protein
VKVFWSWQSDTPGEIGRFLVRDALNNAIEKLKQDNSIEDAPRDLHLDHDIKDTTGSPDLVRTILEKIEKSEVVVADVTIVGKTADGKCLINSNVAIELGYAWSECTDSRVVFVFNAHYGEYDDLPFDLRHKGGAVVFHLAPDADGKEIDAQRKSLTEGFVRKLKPFLQQPSRIKGSLSLRAVLQHRLDRSYRMPNGGSDELFRLQAMVENDGEQAASDFRLDLEIPGEFVDSGLPYGAQVPSARVGYSAVSITNAQAKIPILYRRDKTRALFDVPIGVRDDIKRLRPESLEKKIIATVYSGDMEPQATAISVNDLYGDLTNLRPAAS